ncbi:nickel-binding protein [Fodinicurvata halophila]|uniref:nickel-binding protein n=1 Tax=Fodinicurvata halophila TaxID=1419723 RepID=UPI00362C941A
MNARSPGGRDERGTTPGGIACIQCRARRARPEELQWLNSYICDDKIYCVYIAANEDIIHEHARCLDVPANRISRIKAVTDPSSGE